jgi:hypothetical protein
MMMSRSICRCHGRENKRVSREGEVDKDDVKAVRSDKVGATIVVLKLHYSGPLYYILHQ